MSSKPPKDVMAAYKKVTVVAASIANKAVREKFIDTEFAGQGKLSQAIGALSVKTKGILLEQWNPFVPDTQNGTLALRLRDSDNFFLTKGIDRDYLEQIVTDSIMTAIVKDSGDFMQVMLADILTYPEDMSYFRQPSYDSDVKAFRDSKGRFARKSEWQ